MANQAKVFSNKILTSARNGEIITWDLNRNNNVKYGAHNSLLVYEFSHIRPKSGERAIIRARSTGWRTRVSSIIIASRDPRMVMFGYG